MTTATIVNPETGKSVKVRVWDVNPREVVASVKAGATVKDLSWRLLSEKAAVRTMERQMDGEAASSNFALAVFEHALDWRLGATIIEVIRSATRVGKFPKPFKVGVSRSGGVFVLFQSGRIFKAS